ncbi:hypothetical protein VTI74DRAFT_5032 [Chaetomium olivicolor]
MTGAPVDCPGFDHIVPLKRNPTWGVSLLGLTTKKPLNTWIHWIAPTSTLRANLLVDLVARLSTRCGSSKRFPATTRDARKEIGPKLSGPRDGLITALPSNASRFMHEWEAEAWVRTHSRQAASTEWPAGRGPGRLARPDRIFLEGSAESKSGAGRSSPLTGRGGISPCLLPHAIVQPHSLVAAWERRPHTPPPPFCLSCPPYPLFVLRKNWRDRIGSLLSAHRLSHTGAPPCSGSVRAAGRK